MFSWKVVSRVTYNRRPEAVYAAHGRGGIVEEAHSFKKQAHSHYLDGSWPGPAAAERAAAPWLSR